VRIAITGANGRLGRELCALDWGPHEVLAWTRADADLSRWDATRVLFERGRPNVVVHTASSVDVVRCEVDKQFAWENVALPAIHVARACVPSTRLVHISTDYVFSGDEPVHPIPVATRPDPVNYYGVCKVASEAAALVAPNALVVRTTMKPRGAWRHARAPRDMWISHSYYDEVARFVRDATLSEKTGVVHFGARDVNVYEFAKQERADVVPVDRADVPGVRLPGDIRLAREHA